MDNEYSDFCKWICDSESRQVFDSKGVVTPKGKKLIEVLEKNPDVILQYLYQNIEGKKLSYVFETDQILFVDKDDNLCEEVLKSLKERFLPQKV